MNEAKSLRAQAKPVRFSDYMPGSYYNVPVPVPREPEGPVYWESDWKPKDEHLKNGDGYGVLTCRVCLRAYLGRPAIVASETQAERQEQTECSDCLANLILCQLVAKSWEQTHREKMSLARYNRQMADLAAARDLSPRRADRRG